MIAKYLFVSSVAFLVLPFVLSEHLSAQVTVVGPNLIANPSFETGDKGKALPERWKADRAVYRRDLEVARTGSASMRYENGDSDRYVFCVQDIKLTPGRKYRYSVWIKTKEIKGPNQDGASICIEWNGPDGRWAGGSYAGSVSGTSDWTRQWGVMRIPKDATSPRLLLYTRKHVTGTAWFDDVQLVRVADPVLSTIVASPVYRGWITVDEQKNVVPREAVIRARVALRDHDLSPEQVAVRATLRKVNDAGELEKAVVHETRGKPDKLTLDGRVVRDMVDLRFPTTKLSPGTYDVETEVVGPHGRCLDSTHNRLVRQSNDFNPHSTIDQHQRLLIDGRPFFPLGMYWSSINEEDIEQYADSKFNCLMPYDSPSGEQMDIVQKHGLKVIYSIKDWYFGAKRCPGFIKSIADEEPAIRQRVQEFRNHPALLAWYLNDELPLPFMPQLETHQRIVEEEDIDHPTWVVLYQIHQVGNYLRTFDVVGTDPYPIGRRSAAEAAPAVASQWTVETSRQVLYARPMWQVPQVFNWKNYRKDGNVDQNARTPSFEEMRNMAWQCIAEGATGLIFYSWFDIQRNPDVPFDTQWSRLKHLAAEIDQMAPVLLSVDPTPTVSLLDAEKQRGLHLLTRSHRGKTYLIAVNDGTTESTIQFNVKTTKAIHVLGENRTIEPTATGFSDHSEKLSVHIYELRP